MKRLWPFLCLAAFAACERSSPGDAPGARIDLAVSALSLSSVEDAVWDVQVVSVGLAGAPDEVVWQRRVSSARFGDGRGSVSYVGPCDASAGASRVRVWIVGLYDHTLGAAEVGEFAAGAGGVAATSLPFTNPTASAPLERAFTCLPDADVPVAFDVTLVRPATQGFFDVAVSFNHIFCSAKLDCCDDRDGNGCAADGHEDLELLFGADGRRDRTFVLGLACTAGTAAGVATELLRDPIEIDCDIASDAAAFVADLTIDPSAGGPGNLCAAGAVSGCAAVDAGAGVDADDYLFQVASYQGAQELMSGGVAANALFWNVALGVREPLEGCRLRTRASADDAANDLDHVVGGRVEAGAVYPYIVWDVDLGACSQHALGDGPVATTYTGGAGRSFAFHYGPEIGAGPFCDPPCENGGACVAGVCDCAGTSHTGPVCETPLCPPGHLLEGGACVPTLSGLAPSVGVLVPDFAPTHTSYTIDVGPLVTSLTLTPLATAGITVTVAGQATASGSASAPLALVQGDNEVDVVTTSVSGQRTYLVTIVRDPSDVWPPEAPVVTSPASPYTSATDDVVLQGSCESGATVAASGALVGSAPCVGGAFTLTLTSASDGTFVVAVTQTDAADNTSAPTPFTWTRDTTPPPAPVVTAPAGAAAVDAASALTIAGTCESGLTITLGGAASASQPCAGGAFAFEVGATSDGTRAYTVRQVKPLTGVASDAVTVTWTRDTEPPAAPERTAPLASPFYSGDDLVTLGGTCEPGALVRLAGDASDSAPCAGGAWSFDLVALVNGSLEVTVDQVDAAGNTSAPMTFVWTRDDTVPETPVITTPAATPYDSNSSPLTIAGTCSDAFLVLLTGADTQSATCASGGFSFEVAAPGEGEHTYLVRQESHLTGIGSASASLVWRYDTTAPDAPTLTAPASDPHWSGDDSVTIAGTCEDGATVALAGDASDAEECVAGAFTFVVTRTVNGTYDFTLTQTDRAGNTSAPTGLEWTRDDTAPTTPVVTSHPTPYHGAAATLTLAGTCTEGHLVTLAGAADATQTCTGGAFSFALEALTDGTRDYLVRQTHPLTHIDSGDAGFTWIRDALAPEPIALTAPAPATFTSGSDTVSIEGGCEEGATVVLSGAESASWTCAGGVFSRVVAQANDGTYTYTLVQADAAGNTSSPVEIVWTRDTTIPSTPTLTEPAPSPYTSNDDVLTLGGSCTSGHTVEVTGDATGEIVCVGGAFSLPLGPTLDGTWHYTVIQRSPANGFASAAATYTWTRDRVAPDAPVVTSPAASPWYTAGSPLALAGGCEDGATVTLAGAQSGTAPCVAGAFTFSLTAATNGTRDYTLTVTDVAGNTSLAATFQWVRDDSQPVAPAVTSPTVSPLYTATGGITLSGTCTSAHTVYLQGASTQTATCVEAAFAFPVTADVDGTYVYSLYQESHLTGVASATTSFTWVRDTTAPDEPTVTSLPQSPYFSGDDTIVLGGGCETGATVTLSGAGTDSVVCAGGQYAFEITRLLNTTYNFNLTQTDLAANASLTILFQWVRDNSIPPTPVITSPASPAYTTTSGLTLVGTCVTGYAVHLRGAASADQTCVASAFSFALSAATDGSRDYLVHQTNLSGIDSSATAFTWVRDTQAPGLVVITQPAQNPYNSGDTTFALSGTCEAAATVTLGGAQSGSLTCTAGGTFRFDPAQTVNGTYDYTLQQRDRANNTSGVTAFQWVRDTSKPPTPVISSPTPNPLTSNGNSITIAGSCSGANTVQVTGAQSGSVTCAAGGFSLPFTRTSDGTYIYNVVQVSAINGLSSSAATVTWTRDTTAPGAPTLTSVGAAQQPSSNALPKAIGTTQAGTTTVSLYRNNNCSGAAFTTGTNVNFTGSGIAVAALEQQTMEVSAKAQDLAGNPSACSNSLSYQHRSATRVKDINTAGSGASSPSQFGVVGTKLYFRATDGVVGQELWVSDGTDAGTVMVEDINPADSSNPASITAFNGLAFFSADDGESGAELWRSDGTANGTYMVKDIYDGAFGSTPANFLAVGSVLYFTADDGETGVELWKTDGTEAGTVQVKDIEPGFGGSAPTQLKAVGGVIVFRATTTAEGVDLWKSNGTSAGTTSFDINAGAANGSPNYLVNFGSYVYFQGTEAATGGELWRTNGVTAELVDDIYTGTSGSGPAYLAVAGSTLFFYARMTPGHVGYELYKYTGGAVAELVEDIYPGTTGSTLNSSSPALIVPISSTKVIFRAMTADGAEPWVSDGTAAGTFQLANVNPGSLDSAMSTPVAANGKGYFTATSDGEIELWETDGTVAGTFKRDLNPGTNSSSPSGLVAYGSGVVASVHTAATGREPWLIDGSGPHILSDLNDIPSSSPGSFALFGGALYFAADDGVNGRELWKSDGTSGGTVMIKDINPGVGDASPNALTVAGSYLYFRAEDGANGYELWRTDGTAGGTVMVTDICPGDGASTPNYLVARGTQLVFAANDCTNGIELWSATGTGAATLLKDIHTTAGTSGNPVLLTVLGSKVYFRATTAANGNELWSTDGTTTALLKDVRAGTSSSSPSNLTVVGTRLYFTATESATGVELYVHDTVAATTAIVSDLYTGASSSSPSNLRALGTSTLVFSAIGSATTGRELYKSTSTTSITLISNIRAGAGSSNPGPGLAVGTSLYFSAADDTAGNELWTTNGTTATRIADARVGAASSNPANLTQLDGATVLFTANEGVNGTEMWRTNFTAQGTYLIQDINTLGPSWGGAILTVGTTMFFAASDGQTGIELWKY